MAKKPRVSVTRESSTGRNTQFRDNRTGRTMTRHQFVQEIKRGNYPDYHVRRTNGTPTPASNPDGTKKNNLD